MTDILTILRASVIPQESTQDRAKRELMEYMLTPEGRRSFSDLSKRRFGATLPGIGFRNYSAVGRSFIKVQPMPDGAIPVFARADPADDEDDEG